LPREAARHYIPATAQEIQAMLGALGLSQLDELFAHIPAPARMIDPPDLPEELAMRTSIGMLSHRVRKTACLI